MLSSSSFTFLPLSHHSGRLEERKREGKLVWQTFYPTQNNSLKIKKFPKNKPILQQTKNTKLAYNRHKCNKGDQIAIQLSV